MTPQIAIAQSISSADQTSNAGATTALSPPLQITQLRSSLAGNAVLSGVNLILHTGDVLGLLGVNGAGKTTLIKAALGMVPAEAGMARIFGEPSHALSDHAKARLAYVPQDLDLFGWLNGSELFQLMQSLYPRWDQAEAISLAARWKVPLYSAIATLSVGLRQRLQIVRALATGADLMLLDEPVGALDPAGRRQFLGEMLGRCAEQQCTVLFSTHIVSDLERCANKVAILHQGKILLCSELDALKQCLYKVTLPHAAAHALAQRSECVRSRRIDQTNTLLLLVIATEQKNAWQSLLGTEAVLSTLTLEDFMVELGL